MSAKYAGTGQDAAITTTPGTTAFEVHAITATLRRGWLYYFNFGFGGTPADIAIRMQVMATTAAGTATAVTPKALQSADVASMMTAGENHSAEPTYTAASEFFDVAMPQRSIFQWQAIPGGELVWPATNVNGIGIKCFHASSTVDAECTAHWEE